VRKLIGSFAKIVFRDKIWRQSNLILLTSFEENLWFR
jgi:hypothetical protein